MIKKFLTYSLVVTTMVWSVGLLATPLAVGAAVSGDLIKLSCSSGADVNDPCRAVYYLGADGKRYVFPNEKTYSTWYSDFSGVTDVSSTEMSSYAIGGNATYRPGVKMVKITTDPKVYAVGANGSLMWITDGSIAEAIYGADWTSMIEDVPDAFFVNYSIGSDVNASGDFDKTAQMDAATSINDDKNLAGGGDGGTVSTGTSLSIALASDTPATGIIVGNSINNVFTKVNLTASADGDIVVDQIVIRRAGVVASDAAFSSVALINANTDTRIGNTKSINSEHKAVFNKDFTIPAGTTLTLEIVGNFGSLGGNAGEIPMLELESVTLVGSAAVVGTLPIVGNYQNLNGTIIIGALTVQNGSNNPDVSTQRIGITNYIVAGLKLTSNSVEDFSINSITFDQNGTAGDDDVANLDLVIDDVVVATVASPVSGKVRFDLSANPLVVLKGKNVQVDLQLDIIDGSDRTIDFGLEDESDLRAVGSLYSAEVKVTCGSGTNCTADAEPFWTSNDTTIDKGALTINAATLVSANIPEDIDQVILGKFEFEATGEPVEITVLPLTFTITTSTGDLLVDSTVDLTNVTVYNADGIIVAGPIDPINDGYDAGGTGITLLVATSTDSITVPVGVHIYTIKADLDSDFGTGDTIVVKIAPSAVTAKGEVTGLSITMLGSDDESATMTVQSAQLAISTSALPTANTVVAGTKQHTFANIVLGAESSGEDVKVTKLLVAVRAALGASPSETSNWSIYDGSTKLSTTNDPSSQVATQTNDNEASTSTFTFTTPLVITKGTSKTLTIKADIKTSATDGTISVGVSNPVSGATITAKGKDSALTATITLSQSEGNAQTIISTGTLTVTVHGDTPDAGFIPGDADGITLTTLLIEAQYEDINIEKIYFTATTVNGGGWDQVDAFYVYNGSTLIGSPTVTSTDSTGNTVLLNTTNNPIVVLKGETITLILKADTATVDYKNNSKGSSFEDLTVKISAAGDMTVKGAESGDSITPNVTSASGNAQYLVRTIPVIQLSEDNGNWVTSGGTTDLASFTVTANSAGDVGIHSVSYFISTSTATLTNVFLYEGGAKVATAVVTAIGVGTLGQGSEISNFVLTTDGLVPDSTGSNVLPQKAIVTAGASRTYTLRADIECAIVNCNEATATGGSVTVKFLGDDASIAGGPAPTAATTHVYESSFLWSDFWRTPTLQRSSTTATVTEQWLNGYLIQQANGNDLEATSTGARWTRSN